MQTSNVILYAEDNEDDSILVRHAFAQASIANHLEVVTSGEAAIAYLSGTGAYADRAQNPMPCLVLLDLKMPGLSGLEVLKWIRMTAKVSTLIVVMLTSSHHDSDIHRAYLLGANGYLVKPGNFEGIITMAKAIKDYWLVQNRANVSGKASANPLDPAANP